MSEFDHSWLNAPTVDPVGAGEPPQPVRVLHTYGGQQTTAPPTYSSFGGPDLRRRSLQNVPPFLNKLYNMIWDEQSNDLIRWSDDGLSFIITSQERFAVEVLPRFFKHNKFSSFNRQLNNHGFRKVTHVTTGSYATDMQGENTEFQADLFQRDHPELMARMTRKNDRHARRPVPPTMATTMPSSGIATGPSFMEDMHAGPGGVGIGGQDMGGDTEALDLTRMTKELVAIKQNQASLTNDLHSLQRDNRLLYQELMLSRQSFRNQQDTVDKILKFLATVFAKEDDSKQMYLPRKRRLLGFPSDSGSALRDGSPASSAGNADAHPGSAQNLQQDPPLSIRELGHLFPNQLKHTIPSSNSSGDPRTPHGLTRLGNNIESFAKTLGINTNGLRDMNIDDILETFQKSAVNGMSPRMSYLENGPSQPVLQAPEVSGAGDPGALPQQGQSINALQPGTIPEGLEFPPTSLISPGSSTPPFVSGVGHITREAAAAQLPQGDTALPASAAMRMATDTAPNNGFNDPILHTSATTRASGPSHASAYALNTDPNATSPLATSPVGVPSDGPATASTSPSPPPSLAKNESPSRHPSPGSVKPMLRRSGPPGVIDETFLTDWLRSS